MITKLLPNEIEMYILHFLIMPVDLKILKSVSKKINYTIKNLPHIIKKNHLLNEILMMNEDNYFRYNKEEIHPHLLGILVDKWYDVNKWAWIRPIKNKIISNYWTIGDFVDALDEIDVWGAAYIKDIKLKPSDDDYIETTRLYRVEFLGWDNRFDEWIPQSKIRQLGSKTLNPLSQKNISSPCWILFNDVILGWRITILNKISIKSTKTVVITIKRYYDRGHIIDVSVHLSKLHYYIKPLTNIATYLCVSNNYINLENRKILM